MPTASLIDVNGVLYGTAGYGGTGGRGTVFKVTTSGAESVLYSFTGNSDGDLPYAGVTNVDGVLYGTTEAGGAGGSLGTVFRVTTSGTESVLHSFTGGTDGNGPMGGLTNVDGVLYGTTFAGGTGSCGSFACGTVFKITTSGAESVIYSFKNESDGRGPVAGLTNVGGVLYGTTDFGGTGHHGTVFKITTSGVKSTLYNFTGAAGDGAFPWAGLTELNGVLYGTTHSGGAHDLGTVFSLPL